MGYEFVQDEYGFITHLIMQVQSGDKLVTSQPIMLDWPLEPVAFPEEKANLN